MKPGLTRALLIAGSLVLALAACSEDDNPFLFQGGAREGGGVIPDTLILDAVRDTTAEVELSTGSSNVLIVGRLGGVESVAFLRYTSIPDSSDGIVSAQVTFLVSGAYGDPVRLRLDAAQGGTDWTESDIRWDTQPEATELLYRTPDPVTFPEDSVVVFDIPGNVVIRWIDEPTTNAGIRLSVPAGEPDGLILVRSSEAVIDTSIVLVNPPLAIRYSEASPSTHGPSNDAFVHNRFEGTAWGEDPAWIGLGGWRSRRTLIGFDVAALRDSMQQGPTFSVAGASLLLTILDEATDALPYADTTALGLNVLALADDPPWEEGIAVPDSLPIEGVVSVTTVVPGDGPEERSIGLRTLVRQWVESSRSNGGILLTTSAEISNPTGFRFASRSDSALAGPRLRIIITRPAPPRVEDP